MDSPVSPVTFTTHGALRKSALRHANERLVLNAIRQNPPVSRLEISRITGLSPSSVTFIVKRLAKARLIQEDKLELAPPIGRPPSSLKLARGARLAVGVEITPVRSRVALADWTGEILETREVDWDPDPGVFLPLLRSAIRGFVAPRPGRRVLGVGVSVPGMWDSAAGTVTAAVNLGWRDVAVLPVLSAGIEVPVYFDNNANLSALGERWFRSSGTQPLEHFVFVTLGTGIGSGIIVGGQLLHGAFGRAGEFGHATLVPDGRQCLCGNRGCWEEYASDRALVRIYEEKSGLRAGDPFEVLERARRHELPAAQAIAEAARFLGIGLGNIVMALNPEAIVVDHWVAAGWDLVEATVWETLRERVPAAWLKGVRIQPSAHAQDAPLLGAVALVLTRFFYSFDHFSPGEAANRVQLA